MPTANNKVKVGFLCDISYNSGLGHIKRSLILSEALENSACDCFFFAHFSVSSMLERFIPQQKICSINNTAASLADQLISFFERENFDVLIIDSYTNTYRLEAQIRDHGVLIVSIDDHLLRHDSHLVFNNRAGPILKAIENPKSAIWHIGEKFILTRIPLHIKNQQKRTDKPNKILLHAGGSSAYNQISSIVYESCRAVQRHKLSLEILCSTNFAEDSMNKIIDELNVSQHVKSIPYVTNLANELFKYDLVVGPAGTTTFECLFTGVLALSAPLSDDGRDAPETWPYLGHMLHLNYEEAQDRKTVENLWEFCILNYASLSNILNKRKSIFDGEGSKRTAEIILKHLKSGDVKNLVVASDRLSKNRLSSKVAKLEDARLFLNARNQDFVRNNSSDPDHKISWPEHLNWWLKSNIYRYGLWQGNRIIAFYWSKLVEDDEGRFVVSGWMPVAGVENKFKIAAWVIEHQIKQVKNDFNGELWLISMQKENTVARFLNKRGHFRDATPNSAARAAKAFGVSQKHFDFMEMNL